MFTADTEPHIQSTITPGIIRVPARRTNLIGLTRLRESEPASENLLD